MRQEQQDTQRIPVIQPVIYDKDEPASSKNKKTIPTWIWVIIGFIVVIIIMNMITGGHQTTSSATPSASTSTSQPAVRKTMKTIALDGLAGQKWSNAKKIILSRGAIVEDAVVLTDDGKEPVIDSNWTVDSVARDTNGQVTIHLKHDTNTDVSGVAGDLKNKVSDAYTNLTDGSIGLGKH
jgi:hypothetical protein